MSQAFNIKLGHRGKATRGALDKRLAACIPGHPWHSLTVGGNLSTNSQLSGHPKQKPKNKLFILETLTSNKRSRIQRIVRRARLERVPGISVYCDK